MGREYEQTGLICSIVYNFLSRLGGSMSSEFFEAEDFMPVTPQPRRRRHTAAQIEQIAEQYAKTHNESTKQQRGRR